MNIAILSRGPQLYSTQRLWEAGIRRGHRMKIIDHTQCDLVLASGGAQVIYDGRPLSDLDAVIPRIGSSVTHQGAAVILQMEQMGIFSAAGSQALVQSRDKLRCLQILSQKGIPIPRTVLVSSGEAIEGLIDRVGGLPVVIKLLESTHGVGVILAETTTGAGATIEAFQRLGERVLIQEFIRESAGVDVRALVVDNEVVAAMRREARPGEFRSNLHRGASASPRKLSQRERELVLQSVALLGLEVAGVDLLLSSDGPLVMEVNASPGLEGIEAVTRVKVAEKIIRFVEKGCRRRSRLAVFAF